MELSQLEERIGYRFADSALLEAALTHRSFSNEQERTVPCNERLEFLGDAVLDLAVGEVLFLDYPGLAEGELTRLRAELVNEQTLALAAGHIELGGWLRLGRGEARSGGRGKASLLANALEAVIGAVFRDGGWEAARSLCRRLLGPALSALVVEAPARDSKTRLQELLQEAGGRPPVYLLTDSSGPDHARTFSVEVRLGDRLLGHGEGRTKKAAEQMAAARALALLESEATTVHRRPGKETREP